MAEYWESDRARAERERVDRVALFDKFVDLALDDVITLEQALTGYVEEITTIQQINSGNV